MKRSASGVALSHLRHNRKKLPLHVLNIAAPVTRVRWRPPEDVNSPRGDDHHDSMIVVATSSIYGANAGGNGSVGLWSYHRPYMPMSVCEGHLDGAVSDFVWTAIQHNRRNFEPDPNSASSGEFSLKPNSKMKHSRGRNAEEHIDSNPWRRHDEEVKIPSDQSTTILTVGRDGQILLQNFSRGERPILEVPPATFALANLSPFQPGFGSLQIMAIHQKVTAPDILREKENTASPREHIPNSPLVFSITDSGDVEDLSKKNVPGNVDVAPELTHLSRFSELYATSIGGQFVTKADVCRHNASVAESLQCKAIMQMWRTLATILDGSGLAGLPTSSSHSHLNPMAYVLMPTLRKLLLQRADAGDVQTCVVLCEVMDVVIPPAAAGGLAKSRIPNLNISLVREWYLSYIDLLQQMCLFTQAASLIRSSGDPVVGALNQQSTTIHESCPRCGKPFVGGTTIQNSSASSPQLSAQRVCRSCRGRIGFCFLCHEPVKGIFVTCPGCGHGGHLEHALEWFGMNEFCPTGCGHRCNIFNQQKQCTLVK